MITRLRQVGPQRHWRLTTLILGCLCFSPIFAQFARGQESKPKTQPANEVEAIKKDVQQLQELVREIEGRLFILQQKLSKLQPAKRTNEIDIRADLLTRIFAGLNDVRKAGRLQHIKINVTVGGAGQVLLKGNVNNAEQLKEVLEIVRKIEGVKKIINEIKIVTAAQEQQPDSGKSAFSESSTQLWRTSLLKIDEGMMIDALEHSGRNLR